MGRSRSYIGQIATIACACLSVLPVAAREAQGWTLVDLGTLGGPGSYGAALSDTGYVVGCADVDATSAHAFLYRDGVMHDLGLGGASAAGQSCALAVNNQGVVAGRGASGNLVTWNGAVVTPLGVKGTIGGINDAGTVVGSSGDGAATRAFLYMDGALNALGTAAPSTATAINSRGEVAGSANGQAFVVRGGVAVTLGTLGGNHSEAKGINDLGQLVGMSTDADGLPLSFVYASAMQALEAPTYSNAIAINNSGQVVGSSEATHGYLLDSGRYTRLDTLPPVVEKGWRHIEPTGINNRGWIVGTGSDPDGNLRAFLLIPPTEKIGMRLTRAERAGAPFR